MPDARLEVTDALGRRIVPIAKGQFEIGRRETNDLRLAGSEVSRDHAEIAVAGQPFRAPRPQFALRHLRERRAGRRAHARPRRPDPPRPHRRRGDGLPAGRLAAAGRAGHDDRDRRPAADRRPARRAARARLRPGAGRRAVAGAGFGDRGERRRARLHHAGAADRRARVQDGARQGADDAARQQLRHQPQDSGRSLPHGRAAHRRRPARRRARQHAHRHRRARHPPRAVRAAAPGPLPRSRPRPSARSGASACCISTAARRARCSRTPRAPRSRRWPPRPPSRSRTPGSIARRWRRRGWSRRCGSPRRSSRRCSPRPAAAGVFFKAAAASLPCRSIGGDFYDYVDLSNGSLGFALGDVAGKGPPAALLSAMMQGIFAAQAASSDPPSQTDQPRQPGAVPPRHRVALRDADVRRALSGRPAAVLQRRPQSAAGRRADGLPAARARRADRRAVRGRDLRRGDRHARRRRLADRLQRRRVRGAVGRRARSTARRGSSTCVRKNLEHGAAGAARVAVRRRARLRPRRRAERRHHRDGPEVPADARARARERLALALWVAARNLRRQRHLRRARGARDQGIPVPARAERGGRRPGRPAGCRCMRTTVHRATGVGLLWAALVLLVGVADARLLVHARCG